MRPQAADAALAAGLAATSLVVAGGEVGVAGWLCTVAVHAPLVWRRVPVAVFWVVTGLAGFATYPLGVDGPYLLLAPLAALYTIARHGTRWHSLVAAGLAETFLLWAGHRVS